MTYDELTTKLRDYTETSSTVLSSTIINDFISDAEYRIMTDVDLDVFRQNDFSILTIGAPFLSTPTGILIIRYVVTYNDDGDRTYLQQKDVSFMEEYTGNRTTTGTPKYYAMWHRTNNIQYAVVAPAPSAADTCQVNYIKYPEHLYSSDDAATIPNKQTATYLSTKAPELLFYAVMVNAYGLLKGPMDMYKLYKDKYNSEIQAFALEQTGRRRRGEYTDGTLRIPIASPSPEQWRNLK